MSVPCMLEPFSFWSTFLFKNLLYSSQPGSLLLLLQTVLLKKDIWVTQHYTDVTWRLCEAGPRLRLHSIIQGRAYFVEIQYIFLKREEKNPDRDLLVWQMANWTNQARKDHMYGHGDVSKKIHQSQCIIAQCSKLSQKLWVFDLQ